MPAHFENAESDDPTMFFGNVLVMHSGRNRNGSNLTESAAQKAIKNLAYKPVLANFCEIDGVRDFTSHDFEQDENGNTIYYEKQVGCFTADKATLEQDPEREDRKNVFAKVAIPREYTDAAEIIERKGGTKVSVELAVNELSYSVKDKELVLEDVEVLGLTCLGVDPETGKEVQEGMAGAHIQIEDFSVNKTTFNNELINEITQAVIDRLSDNNKTTERRNDTVADFEKEVTAEEEVVDTTDTPEVVEAEAEVDTEVDTDSEAEDESEREQEVFDDQDPGDDDQEDDTEEDDTEEDDTEEEVVIDDDTLPNKRISHAVSYGEKTMEFAVSLQDKIYALSTLVNDTYAEVDNAWYEVTVYDDDKYVVMKDWWNDRAFKQSYKVKKDVYSLVGDRVEVYAQYLTEDEINRLEDMRSNYSSIEAKLANYEAEPKKMEILNSNEYANIADTAEFAELKKEETHFEMSVDEVREKADALLLAYAKGNKIEFKSGEAEKKPVSVKQFGQKPTKKTGRYGNLFKK